MKAIVLIDGGFLRVAAKKAKKVYTPDLIERFALNCRGDDEDLFRILYYDCAPYTGTVKLPVSGEPFTFQGSDAWLHELSHKDLFAVRRGVLKFRGYKPTRVPVAPNTPLTDAVSRPTSSKRVSTCASVLTLPPMRRISRSTALS